MSVQPLLSVQDLEYALPEKRILFGVNLDVFKGEIVAIMGMSGCGKTSLLKCIAGLTRPTSGRILFDSKDIVPMSESELDKVRLRMGLVFQYAALFDSMNVFNNVAFGLKYHRKLSRIETTECVLERLKEVGMQNSESLFPSQLSGGMKKRVGLARALALAPDVLLYDEPTSGLDPVIAKTIDDLIVYAARQLGVTSVIVSHDIHSIFRIADRIVLLDKGTITAVGTPEELRSSVHPQVQAFLSN